MVLKIFLKLLSQNESESIKNKKNLVLFFLGKEKIFRGESL